MINDKTYTEKREELEKLATPLMDWMFENFNPHATLILDATHAEVVIGEMVVQNLEFDEKYGEY